MFVCIRTTLLMEVLNNFTYTYLLPISFFLQTSHIYLHHVQYIFFLTFIIAQLAPIILGGHLLWIEDTIERSTPTHENCCLALEPDGSIVLADD